MDKNEILNIVRQQLAENLDCSVNDFINEGIFFVANDIRKKPFLEITTMGKGIVISASSEILLSVQNLLAGKSREEIFLNGKYYDKLHMDILENEFEGDYIRNKNIK